MDLIARYLAAVARHLPADQRADITAELSDNLHSALEQKERALGRALDTSEVAALLRGHGHPWLAANRYAPQQYLIGPSLFPYYRRVLTLLLFWVLLPSIPISIAVGVLAQAGAEGQAMMWLRALTNAWTAGLLLMGITTIIFALLEHHQVRLTLLDRWRPEDLPAADAGTTPPRGDALVRLVFDVIFFLWWSGALRLPEVQVSHAFQLTDAGGWQQLYWPILVLSAGNIMLTLAEVVYRPWPHRVHAGLRAALESANIAIVLLLLASGPWIVVTSQAGDAAAAARLQQWLDLTITITLWVVVVIQGYEGLKAARQAWQPGRVLA